MGTAPLWAGMPMPAWMLTEFARERIDALSLFLGLFVVAAVGLRWGWQAARQDIPRLPALSFRGALGLTLLWGLVCTLVLTMIAGVRELMTPGAWQRDGITYRLTGSGNTQPKPVAAGTSPVTNDVSAVSHEAGERADRERSLGTVRGALQEFAREHDGRLPTLAEWDRDRLFRQDPPGFAGLSYLYFPQAELSADEDPLLIAEPAVFPEPLLGLTPSGRVVWLTAEQLRQRQQRLFPQQPGSSPEAAP